jgi:hypothetical protein
MVETSSQKVIDAASKLMKRLPPKQVQKTLVAVGKLVNNEEIEQDLMDKITTSIGKSKRKNLSNSYLYRRNLCRRKNRP